MKRWVLALVAAFALLPLLACATAEGGDSLSGSVVPEQPAQEAAQDVSGDAYVPIAAPPPEPPPPEPEPEPEWQAPAFFALSAGNAHTVAIRGDGTLWAWGQNFTGQLGNGTTVREERAPVRVGNVTAWTQVSAGMGHTIGIRTDNTLWAWGLNINGQLGDGTQTQRISPVRVGTYWRSAAAGGEHTVGISADGSLWAWGNNLSGQLGDGTTVEQRLRPVRIGAATDWRAVAAGGAHTVGIRADCSLWAWGSNMHGQLGNNAHGWGNDRSAPVRIGADANWAQVSAGHEHTVAIRTDGSLWAWGRNEWGQLGDGTGTDRRVPVRIGTDSDWAFVAAGDRHNVAIRTDGSLWAWGHNPQGQLGDNTATLRRVPVQIGTYADWVMVSSGSAHTIAARADGSLWAWGQNFNGRLGDGTMTGRRSPVPVAMP